MADEKSVTGFLTSLTGFYKLDKFSDIQIECEGHTFKVHKLVLANHSPVLVNHLDGEWKEAKDGVIKIEDSEIAVVDAMVFFMYNFHYNGGDHFESRAPALVFHAQVYSIADIYDMQYLKEHSKKLFQEDVEAGWKTDDFSRAVQEVYTSTPQNDRGLRDIVITVARSHSKDLAARETFKNALSQTRDLAVDLALNLATAAPGPSIQLYRAYCSDEHCSKESVRTKQKSVWLSTQPSSAISTNLTCACGKGMNVKPELFTDW